MKHISRNIFSKYTYENGLLYVFRVNKKNRGIFLTQEMAEEARLENDFDKSMWRGYTLDNITQLPEDEVVPSKIRLHLPTGRWYVELRYKDDIIVSDLYSNKKEVKEIQEYLDRNRWSVKALNHQKKEKSQCTRQYAGILPTKQGYLVVDSDKNEYGLFEKLEEAVLKRNEIRSRRGLI